METVRTILQIKIPASTVWNAITDKNAFQKWYFTIPEFNTEVGAIFEFYESEETKNYLHRCEVLETVKGKLFKHTWTHPSHSKGSSVVTWEIESMGEETKLTLTHEGLESFADAGSDFSPANFQIGWDAIIQTGLRNCLVGIERLEFQQEIKAKPSVIWENMWNRENYKKWTTPFCEGSYYTGEMKQGGRIHFLVPDGSGMYSDVFFLAENKTVVFKHIGELKNFKEQEIDEATRRWTGCFEIYKLMEMVDGLTKLTAEVDCTKEHIAYMNQKFPLGLEVIKTLSENQ